MPHWQIVASVLSTAVLLAGSWLTYRAARQGSHDDRLIEERRVEIEGLKAAVEALKIAQDTTSEQVKGLRAEVRDVKAELRGSEGYIAQLVEHINAHRPPPPPPRIYPIPSATTPEGHA